jgi:hypothetical protein
VTQPHVSITRALRNAAQRYQQDGYEVIIRPTPVQLPPWLSDFGVDLLAVSDTERVVVQLKAREEVKNNKQLIDLASVVAEHPGWRYDLVSIPSRQGPSLRGTRLWDSEQVKSSLTVAGQLIETHHQEMGFVVAWSAFEATLRLVAEAHDIRTENMSPPALIKQLVVDGLLLRSDFAFLDRATTVRNSLVHGLASPEPIDRLPNRLVKLSERLLTRLATESDRRQRSINRMRPDHQIKAPTQPISDPEILEKRREALARARKVRAERLAAAKDEDGRSA